MQKSFAQRGVAADRLALLNYVPSVLGHLDQYNQVDVSLDTFPYHGTTTTCEALWMGVPNVTLEGPNHASRPGVSLLSNVGLGDLIAHTAAEYVDNAVQLAGDRSRLAEIRAGLRERMRESPLTDGRAFARDMEAGYRTVWRTWCATAE